MLFFREMPQFHCPSGKPISFQHKKVCVKKGKKYDTVYHEKYCRKFTNLRVPLQKRSLDFVRQCLSLVKYF